MPDRPRLLKQETEYSCGPACLRMVLEAYGISRTEAELRELTNCSVLGTEPLNIVGAARGLGFATTGMFTLNLEQLSEKIGVGLYPIVLIRARLGPDLPRDWHCVVCTAVSERKVELLDPWRGELSISIKEFLRDWSRGLTILLRE